MNELDTAISTALQSLNISWCPAMKTKAQVVLADMEYYPCMIEVIETETEDMPNGEVKENRKFYLVTPKGTEEDVLLVKELHEELLVLVRLFQDQLSDSFKCNFVGKQSKVIDDLHILEAGISFELEIYYLPCQL